MENPWIFYLILVLRGPLRRFLGIRGPTPGRGWIRGPRNGMLQVSLLVDVGWVGFCFMSRVATARRWDRGSSVACTASRGVRQHRRAPASSVGWTRSFISMPSFAEKAHLQAAVLLLVDTNTGTGRYCARSHIACPWSPRIQWSTPGPKAC